MAAQPQPAPSLRDALRQIINAYRLSQCVYVAAELGIADWLRDGPKHYEDLAKASGADPQALFRLLRTLASAGIFTRRKGERFELNEMAQYLRRDVSGSLRTGAILAGQQLYPAWSQLLHSVTTGEIAFDHLHGMSLWQYGAQNTQAGQVFNEAMSGLVSTVADAVVEACDFSRFDLIVDVGGGQGVLLASILKANPAVHGVLFDQPQVVAGATELLKEAGVWERCEIVAGSFLEAVPGGGDAYVLSRVIHDWDDRRSVQILQNCRRAMKEDQSLFIIDRVLASDRPTVDAVLADMHMMVMAGGCERTQEEFRTLVSAAGFALTNFRPTSSPFHVIEAITV